MPFKFNALTGNLDLVNADTLGGLTPTKGNIAVGDGSSWTVLAVGANDTVLTADSGEATGIKWAATTVAIDNKFWEARDLDVSYTPIAPLEQNTTTNIISKSRAFDYATIEYCNSSYYVPSDIDTAGTVTFYVFWQARTAPASDEDVVWQVEHSAVADAEDLDSATFTAEVATAAATSTVQNQLNYTTWTETVSNLGWAAADEVFLKWSRKSTDANDTFDTRATTADDALAFKFGMLVPRA